MESERSDLWKSLGEYDETEEYNWLVEYEQEELDTALTRSVIDQELQDELQQYDKYWKVLSF